MKEQLTFFDLKEGQKFVILPGKRYNPRRDGDYLRANYLFVRAAGPGGKALRLCDGQIFDILDDIPILRVQDSGRTLEKDRKRGNHGS
jgi:hypothetical protein